MILAFLICWTPYAAFSILVTTRPSIELDPRLAAIPAFFSKTATVYNPVIYVFMNNQVLLIKNSNPYESMKKVPTWFYYVFFKLMNLIAYILAWSAKGNNCHLKRLINGPGAIESSIGEIDAKHWTSFSFTHLFSVIHLVASIFILNIFEPPMAVAMLQCSLIWCHFNAYIYYALIPF